MMHIVYTFTAMVMHRHHRRIFVQRNHLFLVYLKVYVETRTPLNSKLFIYIWSRLFESLKQLTQYLLELHRIN